MTTIDEVFRELRLTGNVEHLRSLPAVAERWAYLEQVMPKVNITKERLSFFSEDEQLRLAYLIQARGVDLGLCPLFYIFFSRRHSKWHYVCKGTADKKRTACRGVMTKCDQGIYDSEGKKI